MSRAKIGLSMLFCLGESFTSLLKRLDEVDVRYVEILDEGLHTINGRRIKALKKIAQLHGLELTLHAPFVDINIASPVPFLRRIYLKRLEKSIVYASQLNCRLWVFHSGRKTGVIPYYPKLDWRLNLEATKTLLMIARKHEVEVAVENLPEPHPFLLKSVSDFSRFYNELGTDVWLALDIGHANLNNQIHDFITQFSKRIIHMHASDNEGIHDSHLGIGRGNIPWQKVAETIKEIKYCNKIMIESVAEVKESLQALQKLLH